MGLILDPGLVDLFGGLEDLEAGIVRCVGEARERFREDALRILRAIRFSAQLGFSIEEETLAAVEELAPTLRRISAERIQAELVKLMVSPHPDYLRTAYDKGVTKVILPEFDKAMETPQNHPHHCYSVGEHILKSLEHVEPDKVLRGSVLATLQSKLLSGAASVLFGLLGKLGDKTAVNAAAAYLGSGVYQLYRHLYRCAGGDEKYFSLPPEGRGVVAADQALAELRYARALRGRTEFPDLSPEALASAYPGQNQSLTQVLSTADARLVRLSEEQP